MNLEIKTFIVGNSIFKNQCYLIYENGNGVLVDPAWEFELLNDFLEVNSITLKGIILTHSHHDHTNLTSQFVDKYDIPVFISKKEADYYSFDCKNLIQFDSQELIRIAQFEILPVFTSGHTKGSVCYLIKENLFSGDTIFIEGVGICDQEGGDVNEMFDSVQYIKDRLPNTTMFWPGHSFGQAPGKDKLFLLQYNIYFMFDKREDFVKFRMRKYQSSPLNFC